MPIALEKDRPTCRLFLKRDAEKPEAERPEFICGYLTGREWKRLAHIEDEIKEKKESLTGPQSVDMLFDAFRIGLIGWENMDRDYDPAELDDFLSLGELRELIGLLLVQSMLGPDAKNASGSPSPSSPDKSAKDVETPTTEPDASQK